MSAPLEVVRKARSLGLTVEADGGDLVVKPRSKCPAEFVAELKQHKAELLNLLSRPSCPGWQAVPPTDLPLNPQRPKPQPADARRVMDYIVRQIGDGPGPLCEWCLKREDAYWNRYHWPFEVCAYAAARDCATWQLNRDEHGVLELLSTFDAARIVDGQTVWHDQ